MPPVPASSDVPIASTRSERLARAASAIELRGLTRSFFRKREGVRTEWQALAGIDLTVRQGEIFALLGPNGAGKTTLIKILTTLLLPTSGEALVDGHDVVKQTQDVRERIAIVSGGEETGYGILTVRETIWLFSQFHGIPGKLVRTRTDALLARFGLAADAGTKVNRLSTGMRQKMNLIRALVVDPRILFLDEPTLGLDVHTSRIVRAYLREWVAERPERTVFVTTHYMAEADEIADRVAIMNQGLILVVDSPGRLKRTYAGAPAYRLVLSRGLDPAHVKALPGVVEVRSSGTLDDGRFELTIALGQESHIAATLAALNHGTELLSVSRLEPTLEEVFVRLVGARIEDADEPVAQTPGT